MSKERYKYGLGNFDDYDLIEVIDDTKENKDYVNMEEIAKILNEQDQKIKELEHRLSNCIEPKYKVGDKAYALISGVIDSYIKPVDITGIMLGYKVFDGDNISNQNYNRIFSTEEEAKAKLREIQNG